MNQQNPNQPFAPQPYQPQPPKKKHTLRTVLIILGSVFVGIPVLVGVIGAVVGTNAKAPVSVTTQATAKPKAPTTISAPAATQPTTVEPTTEALKPSLTKSQEQAIGSAEQYLSFTAFSRKGLIRQLSSDAGEGFSVADATYAVDHIEVNWNEQAAKSAEKYLEMTHFSRSGLIQQLESSAGEGFTHAQAVYGVTKAGL